MTDNEIIKALECCGKNPPICIECSYKGKCNRKDCYDYLKGDALTLIHRQQAEIERLQGKVDMYEEERKYHFEMSRQRIAEAIKEFAERLKKLARPFPFYIIEAVCGVTVTDIDNLVKEMVGE